MLSAHIPEAEADAPVDEDWDDSRPTRSPPPSGEADATAPDTEPLSSHDNSSSDDGAEIEVQTGSLPPEEAAAIDDLFDDDPIEVGDDELLEGRDSAIIGEREPPSISADEFDKARGKSASIPPPGATATSSLLIIQIRLKLDDQYGLTIPDNDDLTNDTIQAVDEIVVHRKWPEDEQRTRAAIVQILHALDPKSYAINEALRNGDFASLRNVLCTELRQSKKKKLLQAARKLEAHLPKQASEA